MIKTSHHHTLCNQIQTIFTDEKCLKNSQWTVLKWIKKLSKFDEDFIKNYDENSNKVYIIGVDVEYQKKLFNLHKDLPFLGERNKIEK